MNHLTVIAHGEPNSFARRVQVDPTIAVELVQKVRAWAEARSRLGHDSTPKYLTACDELFAHFRTMQTLHGI